MTEIIFRVGNYDDDLAGFGVFINSGRNVPETLPALRPRSFFFGNAHPQLCHKQGKRSKRPEVSGMSERRVRGAGSDGRAAAAGVRISEIECGGRS